MDFSHYFSFEQFKHLHTLCMDKDENKSPKPEFYSTMPIYNKAVANFVKQVSQEKGLMAFEFGEGHDTVIQHRWNKLMKKEETVEMQDDAFGSSFRMRLIQAFPRQDVTEESLKTAYTDLVKSVTKGDFDHWELSNHEQCQTCGQSLQVEFKNWNPTFLAHDAELRDFVKPKSCVKDEIIELEVTFQTGELLVADWFRIQEFSDAVNYNPDYTKVSINYSAGREASTRFALDNFNVINIHVGNNSPSILKKGDDLIFAWDDEEKKHKYENIGRVCTDLWNVTMVERHQLVNIVAEKHGQEKAEEIVENYLNESDYEEVNVTPGTYKLRFHPDYNKFKKMAQDKTIPKSVEAFFTLKKVEMEKTTENTKDKTKKMKM
jgi:hypothetical protein